MLKIGEKRFPYININSINNITLVIFNGLTHSLKSLKKWIKFLCKLNNRYKYKNILLLLFNPAYFTFQLIRTLMDLRKPP